MALHGAQSSKLEQQARGVWGHAGASLAGGHAGWKGWHWVVEGASLTRGL